MHTLPESIRPLLAQIVDRFHRSLGDKLVGIYLHGSLVMDCFNPHSSDVDFIVVVHHPLSVEDKRALIAHTLALAEDAPPKGLEFSVVTLDAAQRVTHPTPYELHYSKDWHEMYLTIEAEAAPHGSDADLAGHFTIVRQRGLCLIGQPIAEVFGNVPTAYYRDSIVRDAHAILADVSRNPVYGVLNLCRVLAFQRDGLIASKAEGGQWGLANLDPRFHDLIAYALHVYQSPHPAESVWDTEELAAFAAYVQRLL